MGYHDAACAFVLDGELVFAAQEERYTRLRFDHRPPYRAVLKGLAFLGLQRHNIDLVAYYEDPVAKVSRQVASLAGEFPLGRGLDPRRPANDIREKLGISAPVDFVKHHEAHGASAFYTSGFTEAAVLTLDAVGEWATSSWALARNDGTYDVLRETSFPNSVGLFYSAITALLGFTVNSDEYKVMGLAPYGIPRYADRLRSVVKVGTGGEPFQIDDRIYGIASGRMYSDYLVQLVGVDPRPPSGEIEQAHRDLAASTQLLLEEVVLAEARSLRAATAQENLAYAGGVALNCAANGALRRRSGFTDLFVHPAAGDAGGAVGAAMLATTRHGLHRPSQRMRSARLGASYDDDIRDLVMESGLPFRRFESTQDLCALVAARLADQCVVGWYQGREEFGPRALGGRSILADPRSLSMRERVNASVKQRENFRPFAPVATMRSAKVLFDLDRELPFMLETVSVRHDGIPAVTHVDGSARVQTVAEGDDPLFYHLLVAFGGLTGIECLLNTSFNIKGEPIVSSPSDALECFVRTQLDVLVLAGWVLYSSDIPKSMPDWLPPLSGASSISPSVYTLY